MSNVSFITGRESVLVNPKEAAKTASKVAGYFNPCAPIGKPKNVEQAVKNEISPAVKSYMKSHAGINPVTTDSAKAGSTMEYFG